MQVSPAAESPLTADVILCGVGTDLVLGPEAAKLNEITQGAIQRLIDCQEITGKLAETTVVLAPSSLEATHLVIVGTGDEISVGNAFRIAAAGIRSVTTKLRQQVLFAFDTGWNEDQQEAAVAGAIVGSSGQDLYRKKRKRFAPNSVVMSGVSESACQRVRVA